MSTETKVKCDRCGHEFIVGDKDTEREMYTVGVVYISDTGRDLVYSPARQESDVGKADWCRECCKEAGIWRIRPKPNEPEPEYPSLEDLIREIARQEAQDVATG